MESFKTKTTQSGVSEQSKEVVSFLQENPDYILESIETIHHQGISRDKITIRHKDSIVVLKSHPVYDAKAKIIAMSYESIQKQFEEWVQTV